MELGLFVLILTFQSATIAFFYSLFFSMKRRFSFFWKMTLFMMIVVYPVNNLIPSRAMIFRNVFNCALEFLFLCQTIRQEPKKRLLFGILLCQIALVVSEILAVSFTYFLLHRPPELAEFDAVEHGRHVFCLFVRFMPASSLVVWHDSRVFQSPACERANERIFDFTHAECDFSRFMRLSYFRTLQRVVFSKKLLDRSWRLVYHQFVYVSFLVSLCEAGETEKIHGIAGKRICHANALLFRNRG